MARLRDNRRQKLYDAENAAFKGMECDKDGMSVAECQEYVDRIIRSRWWGARYGQRPQIRVHDGRGHRRAVAYGAYRFSSDRVIALPLRARKPWVIIHEMAHHAAPISHNHPISAHGPEFAKEYHALVKRFIGAEEAKALKEAFKEHRVKFRVTR